MPVYTIIGSMPLYKIVDSMSLTLMRGNATQVKSACSCQLFVILNYIKDHCSDMDPYTRIDNRNTGQFVLESEVKPKNWVCHLMSPTLGRLTSYYATCCFQCLLSVQYRSSSLVGVPFPDPPQMPKSTDSLVCYLKLFKAGRTLSGISEATSRSCQKACDPLPWPWHPLECIVEVFSNAFAGHARAKGGGPRLHCVT